MKNIALLLVIGTLFQGCAGIVQPTASRPLVEQETIHTTSTVDQALNSILSKAKSGTSVLNNNHSSVLGDKFIAATGLTCRKIESERYGQDIYCLKSQGNWLKIERVISEFNDNEALEVNL